jgi:hypothetical protein
LRGVVLGVRHALQLLAEGHGAGEGVSEELGAEIELGAYAALPVKGADLLEVEADEGVAVAEGVVEEGEGFVFAEGEQPEGELGQLDGGGVLVDAVEAAFGDEALGVVVGPAVGLEDALELAGAGPGGDDLGGEGAAGGDEEGAGAHRGIADLEAEELVGRAALAQAREERLEGARDDLLGEGARGVVAGGTSALLPRLEDEAARGARRVGAAYAERGGELGREGLVGRGARRGGAEEGVHPRDLSAREIALVFEVAIAFGLGAGAEGGDLDPHAGLADPDGRARDAEDVVAHEGLVDAADLFDVEGAVGEALAAEEDEALEDLVEGAVVEAGEVNRGAGGRVADGGGPVRLAALEEGEGVGIEELAAAGGEGEVAVARAEVDRAGEGREVAVGAEAAASRARRSIRPEREKWVA